MGIPGLPSLIQSVAGSYAMKQYEFSRFAGMSVAIDTSLIVHQSAVALRSTGKDLKNAKGELTSHLYGIFFKILIFLQYGMKPIFVFDGKAPDIKNETIKNRSAKKKIAQKNIDQLEESIDSDSDNETYIKNFKQTFSPTKKDYDEVRIMLDLMGIPYINAPEEADVVCSWLSSRYDKSTGKRYVKGVCSDDSDMLVFGASYLFKDMLKFMSKNKKVKVISLHKTLVKMNITMDQFVDMCVLIGCDYCKNIKGIGKGTAYKLIKAHGSLEKVIKFIKKNKKYQIEDQNLEENDENVNENCLRSAAKYFKEALDKLDHSDKFVITEENLNLRQFQFDELMDFMCVKHGFDPERINNAIIRLKEYYSKMGITKVNTKFYHKILQPRSENYLFRSVEEDDIDFISDSNSDSDSHSDNSSDSNNHSIKSKDTINSDLIKKKPIVTKPPVVKAVKGNWKVPPRKIILRKLEEPVSSNSDEKNTMSFGG